MIQPLIATASIAIQKPISEVFEAIIDPEKMKHYFISEGSNVMKEGGNVYWSFPEFEGSFPVKITAIENNSKIDFVWDDQSVVTITLEALEELSTKINVVEQGYQLDEAGVKWVVGQTEGWANFLACMKTWMEYGIHLRKGAFEFMKAK